MLPWQQPRAQCLQLRLPISHFLLNLSVYSSALAPLRATHTRAHTDVSPLSCSIWSCWGKKIRFSTQWSESALTSSPRSTRQHLCMCVDASAHVCLCAFMRPGDISGPGWRRLKHTGAFHKSINQLCANCGDVKRVQIIRTLKLLAGVDRRFDFTAKPKQWRAGVIKFSDSCGKSSI